MNRYTFQSYANGKSAVRVAPKKQAAARKQSAVRLEQQNTRGPEGTREKVQCELRTKIQWIAM